MLHSRPRRIPPLALALALGLLAACGGDSSTACAPTDPACGNTPTPDPLVVLAVSPDDGAAEVDPSTPVVVTFSRSVQASSVTSSSVTVGSAEGELSVNGAKVTFTPTAALAGDTEYEVRVQGVRDVDGVGMAAPFSSSFTTQVPMEPLAVTGVEPADGAKHVDLSSNVILTFSRPVDAASVSSESITLGSAEGEWAVTGATVTFTPSTPLDTDAEYQLSVSGVRDVEGTGMAAAFTSSFRTRADAVCTDCPASSYSRDDVRAEGTVVETETGFIVEGSLSLDLGEEKQVTFEEADLDVRFDENGKLQSISGSVQIPSPHERIEFADPIRAEVGLFRGSFLNQERDLGILLKDDTDYFVFDFEVALEMSIATGETGEEATKPVVVRAPLGGRLLMVIDYRDPMYYVYGSQDLIGSAGTGWSLNSRIPFVPQLPVDGLGTFDGGTTRVGTFPVLKILSVTGQMVDNETTELHLSQEDPLASDLRAGYQVGYNGDMALDLFLKDIAGIDIPMADGSGGAWGEASIQNGFEGYAYARGMTSRDDSWWPAFIPARPVVELDAQARLESSGSFQVFLGGEFGWDLPAGRESMSGSFELTEDAMTLEGAIRDGDVVLNVAGQVTGAATTVYIEPPQELLDAIHAGVNGEVLSRIDEARAAWEDLKAATADYEFELSLRGLRSSIPAIVDAAKAELTSRINSALSSQEGTLWYSSLRSQVLNAADPYYDQLDALKAAALNIQDNQATRTAIENALRWVAAHKTFSVTFTYKDPVFGATLYSTTITRQIISDANAAKILEAANNVKYIEETSNLKISMQQIYDQVPDRELFEQVQDDIQDGLVVIKAFDELGFVYPHDGGHTFNLYAVIAGSRYEAGAIDALSVAELAGLLGEAMIQALVSD